jgi:hypothetical protein
VLVTLSSAGAAFDDWHPYCSMSAAFPDETACAVGT